MAGFKLATVKRAQPKSHIADGPNLQFGWAGALPPFSMDGNSLPKTSSNSKAAAEWRVRHCSF
jgi:hypothetical protein